MKHIPILCGAALLLAACTESITCFEYQTEQGLLRVEFPEADIVRVRLSENSDFVDNKTTVVLPEALSNPVRVRLEEAEGQFVLTSDSLQVRIDGKTGAVSYYDSRGTLLLSERDNQPKQCEKIALEQISYDEATSRIEKTADGEKVVMDVLERDTVGTSWRWQVRFAFPQGEPIYGWGSHMEDLLDLKGQKLWLCQHNLKAMVPVINTASGYGLLFDAGCGMRFDDTDDQGLVELEAAQGLDYYFMKGVTMDRVVNRMRKLTGQSPMMPRYLFGYIQSKERFHSSAEIIGAMREFRRRRIPVDMVVQDWNYWPEGWGMMQMDRRYYPDPQALADTVHQLNARLMVSIWPNPQGNAQEKDFKEHGYMLNRSFVNVFDEEARAYYWQWANREFFHEGQGFDAWWCDCSEPTDGDWKFMPEGYGWDSHQDRWMLNLEAQNAVSGAERTSLYALFHAQGIYENQRKTTDRKRVVNLTRSSYAGQQRYATITWNGDTYASWESFRRQIPMGLNFMATGCPYWTVDAGTFFAASRPQWFWKGQYPEGCKDPAFREFYLRMCQWAAYLPVFRSHGSDTPREVWYYGDVGEPYYDALVRNIERRYELLPYIYSLAAKVTLVNYTMARMLAFDFPQDKEARECKTEYMFGPALLVCPVTHPLSETSKLDVYLPAGARWQDAMGNVYEGGQHLACDVSLNEIPVFVRRGSILPKSPVIQYADELNEQTLTIEVVPGEDDSFELYEDDGITYDCEKGQYAVIPLTWNEQSRSLTIGEREGTFTGMKEKRRFIVKVKDGMTEASKEVKYNGGAVTVRF
jgi:alpha-D-xyloside xylohydrolase